MPNGQNEPEKVHDSVAYHSVRFQFKSICGLYGVAYFLEVKTV